MGAAEVVRFLDSLAEVGVEEARALIDHMEKWQSATPASAAPKRISKHEKKMTSIGEAVLSLNANRLVGRQKDPNSCRGLIESYVKAHGRCARKDLLSFINEKKPSVTKNYFDATTSILCSGETPIMNREYSDMGIFYSMV